MSVSGICGRILATIYVGSRRVAAPSQSRTSFSMRCGCVDHAARAQSEPGQHCRRDCHHDKRCAAPTGMVSLTIRQEVTAAFTQYEAAQRALDIYTQGVRELARQNLEVVRQTYTLGRATLMDVIAEQRRYIDIETGYTEALKQTYDAVVDIECAVGTLEP